MLAKEIELGGQEHFGWPPQTASEPFPTPTSSVLLNVTAVESLELEGANLTGVSFAGSFAYGWELQDGQMP